MYEPYGEKKKFQLDFSKIKEKIKEKVGDLNLGNMNKMAFVGIALLLLITLGGITGYVTYTGKVEEMEQKYLVMERQINGLQEELDASNKDLNSCNNVLDSTKNTLEMKTQELSATVLNLEETKNTLQSCNQENSDLNDDIVDLQTSIEDVSQELSDLNDEYDDLENDFGDLACNVAKMSSCDYYVIREGSRVVCCVEFQGQYICSGNIVEDGIREVNC